MRKTFGPCCSYLILANAKGAWVEPGPSPLRRRCLSAVRNSRLDPLFHFFCYPRDPASAKRYPFGECTRAFEPRDVSRTVGDAIDRFEFLLRYELPCHRKALVKGSLQAPVSPGDREHSAKCRTAQPAHSCSCGTADHFLFPKAV